MYIEMLEYIYVLSEEKTFLLLMLIFFWGEAFYYLWSSEGDWKAGLSFHTQLIPHIFGQGIFGDKSSEVWI